MVEPGENVVLCGIFNKATVIDYARRSRDALEFPSEHKKYLAMKKFHARVERLLDKPDWELLIDSQPARDRSCSSLPLGVRRRSCRRPRDTRGR